MQTDMAIQTFFNNISTIRWRECEESKRLRWYYAEGNHYVVNDTETNGFWFVFAKSPAKACDHVIAKLKL